jgi:hypothetical protein
MSETRKLVAILVADVVGYSRLAGADEERTLARLRALRSDLVDPTIALHHGRIVKRTGDGNIVEFRSVVDAVRCASEVQIGLIERNAGLPPERRIEFRVGIRVGDVVEESDGDLMGDGVNIAARLEGICEPGGILPVRGRLPAGEAATGHSGRRSRSKEPQEHHRSNTGLWACGRQFRAGFARAVRAAAGPARQCRRSRCPVSKHERQSWAPMARVSIAEGNVRSCRNSTAERTWQTRNRSRNCDLSIDIRPYPANRASAAPAFGPVAGSRYRSWYGKSARLSDRSGSKLRMGQFDPKHAFPS